MNVQTRRIVLYVHTFKANNFTVNFLRATAVPAGILLRARISYGDSVRPSVCLSVTTRYGLKARWDRDSGSSPCDSLVSSFLWGNLVPLHGWRDSPRTRASKRGTPLRTRYFTTIGSSSVKTVADRRRLAAYHSKHCRRAFQWYQHRW